MKNEETVISMQNEVGNFAEDKDKATQIRIRDILPSLSDGKTVILDFQNVNSTTQSFIHALISDVIRKKGIEVLDKLLFKNCNEVVRAVIEIVVDYMQEPPILINGKMNGKSKDAKTEKKSLNGVD